MTEQPLTMVVIPTYNERENLPLIVAELLALPVNALQVLVVDDNSPDGTGQVADELSAQHEGVVHVLHRTEKAGLGPAYIAGFKRALALGADYIVQMDADFSHQPRYIPDMLVAIEGHDMVLGSRFAPGGSVDESWSFLRKLLSLWANRIYVPAILRIPLNDATGGYRLWRRETLIGIDLDTVRSNGYVFQVEMAYRAYRLGYRLTEIPIHFPDRKHGASKMNSSIALEAALRTLQLWWRLRGLKPDQRRTQEYA